MQGLSVSVHEPCVADYGSSVFAMSTMLPDGAEFVERSALHPEILDVGVAAVRGEASAM